MRALRKVQVRLDGVIGIAAQRWQQALGAGGIHADHLIAHDPGHQVIHVHAEEPAGGRVRCTQLANQSRGTSMRSSIQA